MSGQRWIGSTDFNYMLLDVAGWHVGCYNDLAAREAMEYGIEQGYIGTRAHYAEAFPEGSQAYELTDKGLDYIARTWGLETRTEQVRLRQWYRDYSSTPERARTWYQQRRNEQRDGEQGEGRDK